MPVEPIVPKKPVQKLITDESTSTTWEPGASVIDNSVTSNVTVTTADESIVLMSSAIISVVSTLAILSMATVILCLVSKLDTQYVVFVDLVCVVVVKLFSCCINTS